MTRKETILNMSMTGQTIKRIMKAKGYTVKDLMLRGNRRIMFAPYWDDRCGRLYTYYERLTMVLLA